jgi:hypothetical protein
MKTSFVSLLINISFWRAEWDTVVPSYKASPQDRPPLVKGNLFVTEGMAL